MEPSNGEKTPEKTELSEKTPDIEISESNAANGEQENPKQEQRLQQQQQQKQQQQQQQQQEQQQNQQQQIQAIQQQLRIDGRRSSESTSASVILTNGGRESFGKQIRRAGSTRSSLVSRTEVELEVPVRDSPSHRVRPDMELQVVQFRQRLHEEECNTIRLTKQLSAAEDRRVAETSALQGQITAMQTSLAALRTQLERSEATRQDLELAIAMARRDTAEAEQQALDRAARAELERDEMTRVANQAVQAQMQDTERHQLAVEAYERELMELRARVEEQNLDLKHRNTELQAQTAVLRAHEADVREKNERLARQEELINKLQKERVTLKKSSRELDASREREATLQRELETLMSRVDELVGAVHAEREDNARLRAEKQALDSANAQFTERYSRLSSEKEQLQAAYLRATDQLSELKSEYAAERCKFEMLKRDLDGLRDERDHVMSSTQDSARRYSEAQSRIAELQRRIASGEEMNAKLQEELSTTRSKSARSEESSRKTLKQIESLLATHEEAVAASERASKASKPVETQLQLGLTTSQAAGPKKGGLLERLRTVLVQYEHETGRLRSEVRRVEHDVSHFRLSNSNAQRELGTLRQKLTETQNELLTSQREYATLSERVGELAAVSERQAGTYSSESDKLRQAYDALMSMYEKRRADLRNLIAFEFDVAEHLAELTAATSTGAAPHDPNATRRLLSRPAALYEANDEAIVALCNEARTALSERLVALRAEVARLGECESESNTSKRRAAALQRRVEQLEAGLIEQESRFARERVELEARARDRGVQDETVLSEAMQHVTNAARVQARLESELRACDVAVEKTRRVNRALRFAVALLCSALPKSRAKHDALAAQKRVLQVEIDRQNTVVNKVMHIISSMTDALNVTTSGEQATASASISEVVAGIVDRSLMTFSVIRRQEPLLRFRVAAVAILAANRLRAGAERGMSAAESPWLANLEHHRALTLFRDDALLADLETSLGDLVELIDAGDAADAQELRGENDPQRLADLVRVSNDTLLRKLDRFLSLNDQLNNESQPDTEQQIVEEPRSKSRPGSSKRSKSAADPPPAKKRGSLIHELKRGLKPLIAQSGSKFGVCMLRTDEMGEVLNDLFERMRDRLARAESVRQEATDQMNRLRERVTESDDSSRKLAEYEQRIAELERQLADRIERARYERLRSEFEDTRAREIELTELLNTQTASLRELGTRLDRVSEFESARERQVRSLADQCASLRSALALREGELKARADERSYFEALITDRDRTIDTFVRSRTQLSTFVRRIADQFETTRIQLQLRALNCVSVPWSPSDAAKNGEEASSREREVVKLITSECERLFKELLAETDGRKPEKKRKVDSARSKAKRPSESKNPEEAEAEPQAAEETVTREDDTETRANVAGFRHMLLAVNEFVQFLVGKYSHFDQQLSELRRHAAFLRDELHRSSKRDFEIRSLALASATDDLKCESDRDHEQQETDRSNATEREEAGKTKRSALKTSAKTGEKERDSDSRSGERKKRNGSVSRSGSTQPEASAAKSAARS